MNVDGYHFDHAWQCFSATFTPEQAAEMLRRSGITPEALARATERARAMDSPEMPPESAVIFRREDDDTLTARLDVTPTELIDHAIRHWLWFTPEHCIFCGATNPAQPCKPHTPELRGIEVS